MNAPYPITVTESGMEIRSIPLPLKVSYTIWVIESGRVISCKIPQSEKASSLMLTTEFGMVILIKLLFIKAAYSIAVTEAGILTSSISLQSLNAPSPIFVTLLGILTSNSLPLYFTSIPFTILLPQLTHEFKKRHKQ